MNAKLLFTGCIVFLFQLGWAQKQLDWTLFEKSSYTFRANGTPVLESIPAELNQLDGKEILLSGYLVPIDYSKNLYALSRFPQASCFFCGQAGPETVAELIFSSQPPRLVVDQFVLVRGVLKINRKDSNRLFFQLHDVSFGG